MNYMGVKISVVNCIGYQTISADKLDDHAIKYLPLSIDHTNSQLTVQPCQTLWFQTTSLKPQHSIWYKKIYHQ